MIKIPISQKNYPMYIAGLGVLVLVIGISHSEGGQLVNSVYNATMQNVYHTEPNSKLFDTSGAGLYVSVGVGLIILSAAAYFLPKIRHF